MITTIERQTSLQQLPLYDDEPPPIWIVGSGMTCPVERAGVVTPGVPGTTELCRFLIDRVRRDDRKLEFQERLAKLEQGEPTHGDEVDTGATLVELYHDVCVAHRDSDALESNIRRAVLLATMNSQAVVPRVRLTPDDLERSVGVPGNVPGFSAVSGSGAWSVRPGIRKLVKFIEDHPSQSGHAIVTTNFDPLISVAFNEARAPHVRFSIDGDYLINYVAASVPVVYHVHGYWARGTLLNLKDELNSEARGRLRASLTSLLNHRRIYVLGYSGWDDVVMPAISGALANAARVDWLCYSRGEKFEADVKRVQRRMGGMASKIRFVEGVDGDEYLEEASKLVSGTAGNPLRSEIRVLEDQRQVLERRVLELSRNVERLESIDEKLDSALSKMPEAARYLNDARTVLDTFGKTAAALNQDFARHRENQASRFELVLNSMRSISARLESVYAHTYYCSSWLNGTTHSVLNGLRPPANVPSLPAPYLVDGSSSVPRIARGTQDELG